MSTEPILLSTTDGSVIGVESDHVLVRLGKVEATLPRALLEDQDLARYGAPVRYRVFERDDGTRYHTLSARAPVPDPAIIAEVDALLAQLPGDEDPS